MGDFRPDSRGFRDRGRSSGFGGGRSGGRSFGGGRGGFGGRGRDSGGFGERRRPLEMHDVTCDKCGKECQVPFRPTGDKPVLCSDCFRKNDNFSSGSRNENRGSSAGSGISQEQFNQLNSKLDKILEILELEVVEEDDEDADELTEEDLEEKDETEALAKE